MPFLNGWTDFALRPLNFFVFQSSFDICTFGFIMEAKNSKKDWRRARTDISKIERSWSPIFRAIY